MIMNGRLGAGIARRSGGRFADPVHNLVSGAAGSAASFRPFSFCCTAVVAPGLLEVCECA
jgi:hypothetical protein